MSIEAAREATYFRLAADADQFLTMAKFRAARKLWARVELACGLSPKPLLVTAETAWRMMTQRDAYVNLLRTTIAVAAAGLGGADAITVLPHTAPLGLPDARDDEFLVSESNARAVHQLDRWATWPVMAALLVGPRGLAGEEFPLARPKLLAASQLAVGRDVILVSHIRYHRFDAGIAGVVVAGLIGRGLSERCRQRRRHRGCCGHGGRRRPVDGGARRDQGDEEEGKTHPG